MVLVVVWNIEIDSNISSANREPRGWTKGLGPDDKGEDDGEVLHHGQSIQMCDDVHSKIFDWFARAYDLRESRITYCKLNTIG